MSDEYVYFDGDPETESTRRHMERVLQGQAPQRRWPWLLAAFGSGAVWLLWQSGRDSARGRSDGPQEPKGSKG